MSAFENLLEMAWLGPVLWAALYVSDYVMTIACARLYRAQSTIVFEGSYELNPVFEADVDALRQISPRFVIALIGTTAYLWLVGYVAGPATKYFDLYVCALGALLLAQATVHIRHLRNWFIFSKGTGFIHGRVSYSRSFLFRLSAFEFSLFAGLYFGLFLVTASVFLVGGSLACTAVAVNHYKLARQNRASVSAVA